MIRVRYRDMILEYPTATRVYADHGAWDLYDKDKTEQHSKWVATIPLSAILENGHPQDSPNITAQHGLFE